MENKEHSLEIEEVANDFNEIIQDLKELEEVIGLSLEKSETLKFNIKDFKEMVNEWKKKIKNILHTEKIKYYINEKETYFGMKEKIRNVINEYLKEKYENSKELIEKLLNNNLKEDTIVLEIHELIKFSGCFARSFLIDVFGDWVVEVKTQNIPLTFNIMGRFI